MGAEIEISAYQADEVYVDTGTGDDTVIVEEGWSVKRLVREIVLSRVYRMDSNPSAEAKKLDPDNHLLSHVKRKRLDAESIRDAVARIAAQGLVVEEPSILPLLGSGEPAAWIVSARRPV